MFDVLKDEFEYGLIASVTLGLLLVALIAREWVRRRSLQQAWYPTPPTHVPDAQVGQVESARNAHWHYGCSPWFSLPLPLPLWPLLCSFHSSFPHFTHSLWHFLTFLSSRIYHAWISSYWFHCRLIISSLIFLNLRFKSFLHSSKPILSFLRRTHFRIPWMILM